MTTRQVEYAKSHLKYKLRPVEYIFHYELTLVGLLIFLMTAIIMELFAIGENRNDYFPIVIVTVFFVVPSLISLYLQNQNLKFIPFETDLSPTEIFSRIRIICEENEWIMKETRFSSRNFSESDFEGMDIETNLNLLTGSALDIRIILDRGTLLINVTSSQNSHGGLSSFGVLKWTWNPDKVMNEIKKLSPTKPKKTWGETY